MNSAIAIMRVTIADMLAYRMNFILWRLRQLVSLIILFSFWAAVYGSKQTNLFGVSEASMLTYLLVGAVLRPLLMGTTTMEIGWEINSGQISNALLRPMGIFQMYMAKDTADKFLNIMFSFLEIGLVLLVFRPPLSWPISWESAVLALPLVFIGMILNFYSSIFFGSLGFWLTDIWAPRFLSFVVIDALSGTLFPMEVFPPVVRNIMLHLPFAYFYYYPTAALSGLRTIKGEDVIIGLLWAVAMYSFTAWIWNRGLRKYEAQGR